MIQNQYTVTKEMFVSWSNDSLDKGLQKTFMIFWTAMAIVMLAVTFMLKQPLIIIFALFCIYRAFFRKKMMTALRYKKLLEVHGGSPWLRTISFNGDSINVHEDNYDSTLNRHDIINVKVKKDCISIIFSNKTVLRLYKNCFVNTDSSFDTERFIRQLIS